MSLLILCTGKPLSPLEGSYTSAGFDEAAAAVIRSAAEAPSERRISPGNRVVYIGEGFLARSTAEQILEPCEFHVEPLLNEVDVCSFSDSDRPLPAEKWLRKAASQRKAGDPRQPESREAVSARADMLIQKLEEAGRDSLLITYPIFLAELLDRFRVHNYVVQRGGLFRFQPLEKIVVSRKDEHCGGCQHNCFLSNPGCGVGRDKAMRRRG
ncbi:MAG: histidine phosphatase family protein [Oscillospiraceae bacterium]|nr:histidine phosphatase family protein [Oscillospiraceae bacterium]